VRAFSLLPLAVLAAALLPAGAGANLVPPLDNCLVVTAAGEPVCVYTRPDGGGDPLQACCRMGGQKVDATIILTVLDYYGAPIVGLPAEDMWLEADGVVFCPGGAIADRDTDEDGTTVWRRALGGGGASQPGAATWVLILGVALPQSELDIRWHGPDLNADLVVDLTDVVMFAMDYDGGYAWRSDFHWDGTLNLSDVVLLSTSLGAGCP
jgi:hypothetical protein